MQAEHYYYCQTSWLKGYMTEFRDKYGFTIGIIFVVSTAILIVLIVSKIYHYFYDKHSSKKLVEAQTKYLKRMTPEQVYCDSGVYK